MWEGVLCGVCADKARGSANAPGSSPSGDVLSRNARKGGIQFNSNDTAKGEFRCKEHGAAHAGSNIDEREVFDGRSRMAALPSTDEGVEDRRSDAKVGSGMSVVSMAGFEVATGDKPTGFNAVFKIEGVQGITVIYRQARQNLLFAFRRTSGPILRHV
jgi:hypothetical protein